ncbi:hypothetical protein HDU96_005117, partial [Phlyctochytrium bullatum]
LPIEPPTQNDTPEAHRRRTKANAVTVQAILSNVSDEIMRSINEAPASVSRRASRLYEFLEDNYGVGNAMAVHDMQVALRSIKYEAKDTPLTFVSRAQALYETLVEANEAEQANEQQVVSLLIRALRRAGKENPVWSASRCDELADCTTLRRLKRQMEDLVTKHSRTVPDEPIEAFSITIANDKKKTNRTLGNSKKAGGKDQMHKVRPDPALIAKAKPNSVHTTGYRYGQLKKMSKQQRLSVCKDLTCSVCNKKGHISLDCAQGANGKVAHTQTGYKTTQEFDLNSLNGSLQALSTT